MLNEGIDSMFGTGTSEQKPETVEAEKVQETQIVNKEDIDVKQTVNTSEEPEKEKLSKALSSVTNKFVDKKHQLKNTTKENNELREQVKKMQEQLNEITKVKKPDSIDINSYLSGIKDDDVVDGAQMKNVLGNALKDIAENAFRSGADNMQALFSKQQQELAERFANEQEQKRQQDIELLTEKIESDVISFTKSNPEVDIEGVMEMLTDTDVSKLVKMEGNYAQNAYNLSISKAKRLGLSKPQPEINNNSMAMFEALETYNKR